MKIAHVIPFFQSKLGYQEYYLAREQQKLEHDVCIITSDRYAPFPSFSKTVGNILGERYVGRGTFREDGLKVIRLPTVFEFASEVFLMGLGKALADFNPDIVHAHGETTPITLATILYKTRFQYKVVVDCHMDYSNASKSKIRRALFYAWSRNPICRWILGRADGFFAVTDSSRRWLSHEWGLHYNGIQLIPLGAENGLFSPDLLKRRIMRKKLGLAERDILIVYAGKLVPEKEIETLLKAVAPLIGTNRNVRLLLIGEGPEEYVEKLQQLILKHNIGTNVSFLPLQETAVLANYYAASDVGVWPGSPSITIVEAMAAGLPIVIPSSNDSYSTTLHHYVEYANGFEFEKGNSEELNMHLRRFVTDDSLRKEMGLRSRQLVDEKLNWGSIAVQTLTLYEKLLK